MRPGRSLIVGIALLLYLAPVASSFAQLLTTSPGGLRMDVTARVTGADGKTQVIPVDDDTVLRTGDGVQIRLRVSRDSYVYVIVYGSSQSAVVLHPFSGRREDALMRAGEERVIPGPDRFLPLDRRAGRESIYAFASSSPVRLMSSLLVRMEAGGSDRAAVTEALRASHPETLALSFRHAEAGGAAGAGQAGSETVAAASPAPVLQDAGEQGVLSAEGSRIDAFFGGKPAGSDAPAAAAQDAANTEADGSRPPQAAASKQAPAGDSGSWLGRLFGLGDSDSASTTGESASADEAVPATTYALPATPESDAGSVTVTADAQPAPDAPDVSAQPPTSQASQGVAPGRAPEADPQLNVSVLDDVVASLGNTPDDNGAGTATPAPSPQASPETAAPAPEKPVTGSSVDAASGESASAAPSPEREQTGTGGGSLFGALGNLFGGNQDAGSPDAGDAPGPATEAAPAATAGAGGEPSEEVTPPSTTETTAPGAGEPPAGTEAEAASETRPADTTVPETEPVKTVAIGSAAPAEAEPASKKVVIGPAAPPPPAAEAKAAPGVPPAGDPVQQAEVPASGGFLSGLFGGGSSQSTPPETEKTAPAEPEPSPAQVSSEPPPAPETAAESAAQPEEPPRSGGFLSGLFGGGGSQDAAAETSPEPVPAPAAPESPPAPETVAEPAATPTEPEPESRTVVIGPAVAPAPETTETQETPAAGTTASQTETSRSGGFLSGLFGGSEASTAKASREPAPASAEAAQRPPPAEDVTTAQAAAGSDASPPATATPQPSEPEPSEPESRGLFSGLTSLFGGGSRQSTPPETETAAPAEPEPASPVVVTRQPAAEEPAVEEPAAGSGSGDAGGTGFLGGLTRLFGGNTGASSTAGEQAAPAPAPAQAESSPEPAPSFKTVTRSDGKQVVIVPGPPGRPDAPPASSEVLAREGSKIRALLEPEKQAAPEDDVVAEVAKQGAAPAQPPPAEELTASAAPPAGDTTVTLTPGEAPQQLTAASSPAPAEGGAAVTPDKVQAALEAGAPAARAPAETLAALTAPAPAPEVSVAPVQEIDVNADDNVSSAIVLVVTPTGTGSGVLLDDSGHVLANWHVVNGYSTVSVSFKSPNLGMPSIDRTFSARVVRLNKTADLALLRVDSPPDDVRPVRFADAAAIRAGDVLHAIGHPAGGAWTHTLGKIDDVKPESSWYAGRNLLHRGTVIHAKVLDDPGSAGAPLFNNRLELVGISALDRTKKGVLTGVSVETIRLFLEAPPAGG